MPQDVTDGAAGQIIFQTLSLHTPVIIFPDGKQKKNTVVLVVIADLPVGENLVSIIFDIQTVEEVHRHHHDLTAAELFQLCIFLYNIFFRIGSNDAGFVRYIKRGRRRYHTAEGGCGSEKRKGQHQHCSQKDRQRRAERF